MGRTDIVTTLDEIPWTQPVFALEPLELPRWEHAPPDGQALWQELHGDAEARRAQHAAGADLSSRLNTIARVGWVLAVLGGAAIALFLVGSLLGDVGGYVVSGADSDASGENTPTEAVLAGLVTVAAVATPIGWSVARRRRDPSSRTGVVVVLLLLAAGFFTLGIATLVIGIALLLGRPTIHLGDGRSMKIDAPLLTAAKRQREASAELSSYLSSVEDRYRTELAQRTQQYDASRAAFDRSLESFQRYEPVAPEPDPDLVVIGGSVIERAELVHHLVAASRHAGQVWVLDLVGNGATHKLVQRATTHATSVGVLDASEDSTLQWHLNELLAGPGRRRSLLVEVLAQALAADLDDRSGSRTRDIADTLQRITDVHERAGDAPTLQRIHESIQVLLSGAGGRTAAANDDFGLAGADDPVDGDGRLSSAAVARLRSEFTDDERREYFREWTDIRRKLRSLVDEGGPVAPATPWGAGTAINVAFVTERLASDDLKLRRNVLVGLARNLMRTGDAPPAALVVVGADHLSEEQAAELSSTAEAAEIALSFVFAEATETARRLARGRRSLAVLGGLGSEASEELSTMLGMGWVERATSYQNTWSQAESRSRAETSGRSWSHTDSESRTRSYARGSSHGSSRSEGGYSSTSGSTSTTTTSNTSGSSDTKGGQSSETETRGRTETLGGTDTVGREYEQVRRGFEIAQLAPFTALLRLGGTVRFVDLNGAIGIDQLVLDAARGVALHRRSVTTRPG